jgi:hypothetical protein
MDPANKRLYLIDTSSSLTLSARIMEKVTSGKPDILSHLMLPKAFEVAVTRS